MCLTWEKENLDKNFKIFLVGGSLLAVVGVFLLLKPRRRQLLTPEKLMKRNSRWVQNEATRREVLRLHPSMRDRIADFFDEIEFRTGYVPIVTSGYRDHAKQVQLYNQNLKNAKPGYSLHEYGFAVDINLTKDGKVVVHKQSPKSQWQQVVDIAAKRGLKWGGVFAGYYDPVHFYNEPGGKKSTDLLAMVNSGRVDTQGYVV
jgi:peptidoglycan L-alanyl-D-glutamate endopeptidase CwlK